MYLVASFHPLANTLAADIRGSALPGAAKSNKSLYQSMVFVCVSVMSGRMWIIAQMQLIGF